jgi:hypothetical protein
MLTSLADRQPRRGWSRSRIVETSDIFYFILYPKKRIDQKIINTRIRVCFIYHLYTIYIIYIPSIDGIVTAIGEVGIRGSRSTSRLEVQQVEYSKRGGQRQQPVLTGIVVNNFNFNSPTEGYVNRAKSANSIGTALPFETHVSAGLGCCAKHKPQAKHIEAGFLERRVQFISARAAEGMGRPL